MVGVSNLSVIRFLADDIVAKVHPDLGYGLRVSILAIQSLSTVA